MARARVVFASGSVGANYSSDGRDHDHNDEHDEHERRLRMVGRHDLDFQPTEFLPSLSFWRANIGVAFRW